MTDEEFNHRMKLVQPDGRIADDGKRDDITPSHGWLLVAPCGHITTETVSMMGPEGKMVSGQATYACGFVRRTPQHAAIGESPYLDGDEIMWYAPHAAQKTFPIRFPTIQIGGVQDMNPSLVLLHESAVLGLVSRKGA